MPHSVIDNFNVRGTTNGDVFGLQRTQKMSFFCGATITTSKLKA